jgi:5'-3' exonuclease
MLDKGIKPVFVFDGKPPELKKGEVSIGRSSNSSH